MEVFGAHVDLSSLPMWLSASDRQAARDALDFDDGFSKWHRVQLTLLGLQSAYEEHPLVNTIDFELCGPMSLSHLQSIRATPRVQGGRPYNPPASMGGGQIEASLDGLIDRHWPEARQIILGAISTRQDPVGAVGRALMGPELFDYWVGSQLSREAKRELENGTPSAESATEPASLRI